MRPSSQSSDEARRWLRHALQSAAGALLSGGAGACYAFWKEGQLRERGMKPHRFSGELEPAWIFLLLALLCIGRLIPGVILWRRESQRRLKIGVPK